MLHFPVPPRLFAKVKNIVRFFKRYSMRCIESDKISLSIIIAEIAFINVKYSLEERANTANTPCLLQVKIINLCV